VKNNLSCGIVILTIDLILMERVYLIPYSLWRLGFHLLNKVYEQINLAKGTHLREKIQFLREIDCRFAGERFYRRTEETLTGGLNHIFTKSQRYSSYLTEPS